MCVLEYVGEWVRERECVYTVVSTCIEKGKVTDLLDKRWGLKLELQSDGQRERESVRERVQVNVRERRWYERIKLLDGQTIII